MTRVVLEGSRIAELEDVHTCLAQALDFPAWYGGNLDALFDCLTEPHIHAEICLHDFAQLRQTTGGAADRLLRVLRDAAAKNPALVIRCE